MDQHSDLIAMAAAACGVQLTEVVYDEKVHGQELKMQAGATLPALLTDDGQVLTQTPAILAHVAAGNPIMGGSAMERAQVKQWVNFLRKETWPLAKGVSAFVFG